MPVLRATVLVLLLGVVLTAPARAADPPHRRSACLNKAEQRAAVAAHHAVPLGDAIKTVRSHRHGADVVRAKLCRHGEGLAYVLTLLGRSGKVTLASVDASSGQLIKGR